MENKQNQFWFFGIPYVSDISCVWCYTIRLQIDPRTETDFWFIERIVFSMKMQLFECQAINNNLQFNKVAYLMNIGW